MLSIYTHTIHSQFTVDVIRDTNHNHTLGYLSKSKITTSVYYSFTKLPFILLMFPTKSLLFWSYYTTLLLILLINPTSTFRNTPPLCPTPVFQRVLGRCVRFPSGTRSVRTISLGYSFSAYHIPILVKMEKDWR